MEHYRRDMRIKQAKVSLQVQQLSSVKAKSSKACMRMTFTAKIKWMQMGECRMCLSLLGNAFLCWIVWALQSLQYVDTWPWSYIMKQISLTRLWVIAHQCTSYRIIVLLRYDKRSMEGIYRLVLHQLPCSLQIKSVIWQKVGKKCNLAKAGPYDCWQWRRRPGNR